MPAVSKPGQWIAYLPHRVFVRVGGKVARTLTSSPARRADLVSFLGALCMFLSAIEYIIPKPIPFLRVGIANLPMLFSLDIPTGRVLAAPLGLAITEGVMKSGIMKATAMTGLIGRSFFCSEAIMNERQKIDRKDIKDIIGRTGSIDALLLSVRAAGEPREDTNPAPPTAAIQPFPNAGGLAPLTLLVLGHWDVLCPPFFTLDLSGVGER